MKSIIGNKITKMTFISGLIVFVVPMLGLPSNIKTALIMIIGALLVVMALMEKYSLDSRRIKKIGWKKQGDTYFEEKTNATERNSGTEINGHKS